MTLVLLAAGFVFLAERAAAQDASEIVIGLQNDMTDMNTWNPATNTVWKSYQIGSLNFEPLFSTDLNGVLFPWLADPARGTTGPGYTVLATPDPGDASTVDVFIRTGVTFTDGQTMNADDVVFSYQTQGWGTYASFIMEALWFDVPKWAHWTGGGATSHIGVERITDTQVQFHLSPSRTPGAPPGATYALFFYSTMGVLIMPRHIWELHIDPDPQLNFTSLTPITDSDDLSIDFAFGSPPTTAQVTAHIPATIGTGPWKLNSWSRNQGSSVSVSDTYWGKGRADAAVTVGGVRYGFYPDNLRSIRFVIYTSLDVISLALQSGEIDTLIWSLLPGFLTQVRFNPAISVAQVTDSGMFYLSFNLRRSPWNDIDLRKGISMAIDKDYIVNTLMGGFGIKGTVPYAIVLPQYVNESASPPAFNLAGARAYLDSVGIVDVDGDGFREFKDGSPIRTSILTPPKDYDPVRADAGIMIANNMKKIGLNIDSAPTSFDTIVAKAFLPPVDFDIYILGFLLPTLPELYLKDFFHKDFDVNINPAGSNSAGYNNPEVNALLDKMLITLDNDARTQIVKDVAGIITEEIPWNILYYRKNLNAYRNDRWVGWVNTPPQLYNFWSLSKLARPGLTAPPLPSGAMQVALTIPERAISGRTIPVDVFVSQNLRPVSAASVWLNLTFGGETRVVTGTTDVSGHVRVNWKVPVLQGEASLKATAVKGASSGTLTKLLQITVGPPAPIDTMTLTTTKPVLGVGETTTVVAKLVDGSGAGVAGQTIRVDTTLVFGGIAPSSGVTDATGTVTFTYTAPADAGGFPNQHLTEFLKFNTSAADTVATDTQLQSMVLYVENDNAPNWLIADVEATDLVLSLAVVGDSTTINVRVTDFAGTPQAGVDVESILPESESGIANVTVTATATTSGAGLATFTVTRTAAAVNGNVPIRFRVADTSYEVSDVAGLLITDGTPGHAALIDFSDRSIASSPAQSPTITATIWNQLGLAAADGAVIFQIAPGAVGMQAQFPWAFDASTGQYLDEGVDLNYFDYGGSFGPSFQNSTGQGSGFGVDNMVNDWEVLGYPNTNTVNPIDSCDPDGHVPTATDPTRRDPWPADFAGYYIINATGGLAQAIMPAPHKGDSSIQVRAYIGSTLPASRLHMNVTVCSSNPATFFGWGVSSFKNDLWVPGIENVEFALDSGFVVQRAPTFAVGSLALGSGGQLFTSDARTQKVNATFYDRDGPVANAKVFLTRGAATAARNVMVGPGLPGGTILTDATGKLSVDVTVPLLSLSQAHFFGFLTADERYAYGGRHQLFGGDYAGDYYFNQFLFVVLAKIPMEFVRGYLYIPATVAFATASVDKTLVAEGGTASVTIKVVNGADDPVPNATVWSGPIQTITDANGEATFSVSAGLGAREDLAIVQTQDGQILRAWYGLQASAPVLSYGAISVTAARAGEASRVSVSVTNTLAVAGTTTVTLLVDGAAVASKVVDIGASATQTVTFDYVFPTAKSYSIAVGTATASATIADRPGPDFVLPLGLLAVGLALGAVVGLVLSRRKRPPTSAGSTMAEEEMKPPEGEL